MKKKNVVFAAVLMMFVVCGISCESEDELNPSVDEKQLQQKVNDSQSVSKDVNRPGQRK